MSEKKPKNQHPIFPFQWDGWDEHDVDTICYYDCDVSENFGKILKGNYSSIIDLGMQGILQATNEDGSYIEQRYKANPIKE